MARQKPGTGIDQYRSTGTRVDDLFAAQRQQHEAGQATAAALGSEDYQAAAKRVQDITAANQKLFDVQKRLNDLERRRVALASGGYATQLRQLDQYKRQLADVERMERRVQINARYGRAGGAIAAFAESRQGQFLHGAGATALAVGGGLVANGMSGTVEANRIALELQLISRQLAGAFKPAIDEATAGLVGLRQLLGSLTGGQQRALMLGGLGLAGGYAAQRALVATTGTGLGGVAAQIGLKRAGIAGAAVGEGISAYEGYNAAEATGGGASSYAREYAKRYIPIGPGVYASGVQSMFGGFQDAGRFVNRNIGGSDATFDALQAKADRYSGGLFGAITGRNGNNGGGPARNAVTLPGGDVNDLGSTFFEAMKASASIGTTAGKETSGSIGTTAGKETTIGSVLDWLQRRFGEAPPANPDQVKGK